jgi:hypothetical protein
LFGIASPERVGAFLQCRIRWAKDGRSILRHTCRGQHAKQAKQADLARHFYPLM